MSSKMTVAHIAQDKEFPHFTIYKAKDKGGWEFDLPNLHAFYVTRGYFIVRRSKTKWILIRAIDNIVNEVGKKDLVDEILNFLINVDECPKYIHQFALKDMKQAISDDFLISLPEKQVDFRKDKKDAIQIYYQNCIVKITQAKITTHPYTDLNGYIWESQILQRDFTPTKIDQNADFCRFVFNLANRDISRLDALRTAFGFYIHNYKSAAYCPAIILNDEVISEDPEGGTGKGLFFKAVSKFVKMLTIDGKKFKFEKSFLYQRVQADTKLIFFDDVKKGFDFEMMFSEITEGMTVEKKGLEEIHYEFLDSPKVGISTNYALKGLGNSNDRRRNELEISQYYNGKRTPANEFGHMMFDEWKEDQWQQFDNYMIDCCQIYLNKGIVKQDLINLPEKRLMSETDSDFLSFMPSHMNLFEGMVSKHWLYSEFCRDYPDHLRNKYFGTKKFTSWIKSFAAYHKYTVEDDYITQGTRYYRFKKIQ